MLNKSDASWEATKKRFKALWQRELTDRCCVRVTAWKNAKPYQSEAFPESSEDQKAYWLDGENTLHRELKQMEHTYFAGDAFPHIFSNFGAAGHAAFFKGVHVDFKESLWMEPEESMDAGIPFDVEVDRESLLYKKTIEVIQFLVDQSKGRYFVSMPDISGNLDALAHIRSTDNLLMDMALQPDVVHSALSEIMKIWKEVVLKVDKITRQNNDGGTTIGWLDTWAPGLHAQMQCDLSVMISPEMFETFAMPELEEQSAFLDFPLYHFDGQEQTRHLEHLLSIKKLKMIQWTNVAGQASPVHYIPVLQQIQKAGKGLLIRISDIKEIEPLMQNLSSKGLYLYLEPTLASPEEADSVVKLVNKLTKD